MPAKTKLPSLKDSIKQFSLTSRKALLLLALLTIAGLAAWANTARVTDSSPTNVSAMAPALQLAIGTLNLENTAQAVDSASAAKLLPLWELLEQLDTSGSAAPEEITAVVEEIQLTMTSSQIKAIDAMSIDASQLAIPAGASSATAGTSENSSAQAASAAADPSLGGMPGSDAPMDAGGSMPSSSSQTTTTTSGASSRNAASPAALEQVIQLLESKVQS